jgi:ADP-ribosyl-[dinitrogen reductase] hydrolase
VVASLEAALWAFDRTSSFREAIMPAVNLGDDADTTGAICGQLAGAFYRQAGVPREWITKLYMIDGIHRMGDDLARGLASVGGMGVTECGQPNVDSLSG